MTPTDHHSSQMQNHEPLNPGTGHSAGIGSRIGLSLAITLAFMLVEVTAGLWGNSLALITDAAHNFTDVLSLALSWYAVRLTGRPANADKTFGYHRAGILAALVNSTALVVVAVGIFYESYRRFAAPLHVHADLLMAVGAAGLLVNAGTAWLVSHGSEHDLNLRSVFVHLMADVLSTLGAAVAGVIIYFTGFNQVDPAVSVLIGLLIVWNAWRIVQKALDILLEGTPKDVDMDEMVKDLLDVEGVRGVHDLHVWSISQNLRMMSAHIITGDISIRSGADIQRRINEILGRDYHIAHATLQMECEGCEPDLLYCEIKEQHVEHSH